MQKMDISASHSPTQKSPKTSPIVVQSLNMYLNMKKTKESLVMGAITAVFSAVLLFDLKYKKRCPGDWNYWYYLEIGGLIILGLSLIYYIISYLYYTFCFDVVRGTQSQRKLLNFDEKSFVVEKPAETAEDSKPDPYNITNLSYQKDMSMNSSVANVSAHNWYNAPNLSQSLNASYSLNNSEQNASFNNVYQTPTKNTSIKNEFIADQLTLTTYLNEVAQQERSLTTALNCTQNNISGYNTSNSFWSPNTSHYKNGLFEDMAMFLKTTLYQLSPVQTKSTKDELIYSTKSTTPTDSEEIKKISSAKLSNYVANLRMWISSTILNRIVIEINKVDEAFQQRSLGDLKIGLVGLEKLKKIGENQQLVQMVPQLPTLIPFLNLTSNQEYLVKRIKELAKGSCMVNYKWNSGSFENSFNDEHIPTDSAIIFHLFSTYLDSQLWKSPEYQKRPFYDRYCLMGTNKEIKNKSKCAILCSSPMKPKFNFISDGKIHQLSPDRNNLFYAIIQFLIYMKENSNGSLEGVQLGKSGINILCVVED